MIHAALWLLSATVVLFFVYMGAIVGISVIAWLSLKWRWMYLLLIILIPVAYLYRLDSKPVTAPLTNDSIWFTGTRNVSLCKNISECHSVEAASDGNEIIYIKIPNQGIHYVNNSTCNHNLCTFMDNGVSWWIARDY